MNETAKRIMRDRLMRGRGGEDRRYDRRDHNSHGGYEGEFRGSYERDNRRDYRRDYGEDMAGYDRRDHRRDYGDDYRRDYAMDTGGYPRNSQGEFVDRAMDGNDYRRDYGRDYGEQMKLERRDMMEWTEMLQNADGSHGGHFERRDLEDAVKTQGINLDRFTMDELVMVANMLYSDYCEALGQFIPKDKEKEAMAYVKLAKAFLTDKDAPQGSEKLALYYYCIVAED